jgi:hypothetical protein
MEPNIQWLTPNQQVLYTAGFFNLKKHGPIVMEVPAKGEMLLFGSVFDGWQVPLEDVGPAGLDQSKGGKDFYPAFRFYGPEPAVFDGSYRLPDVKRIR